MTETILYDDKTGAVVAKGNVFERDGYKTVELDSSNIATPLTGSVVDDVDNPTQTQHDIDTIKQNKIKRTKEKAYDLLYEYDWYVIRKTEEGTAIPSSVSEYRSAIRAEEDAVVNEINQATDIDTVKAIEANWPDEPDGY